MAKTEITVDGEKYVLASSINTQVTNTDGLVYSLVRTYSAGVFAGYIKERNGKEATLLNARRIWYWDGAASLSQLATEGTSKPQNCKFPCEVAEVYLTEVIEVIPITQRAAESIKSVPIWKQ